MFKISLYGCTDCQLFNLFLIPVILSVGSRNNLEAFGIFTYLCFAI